MKFSVVFEDQAFEYNEPPTMSVDQVLSYTNTHEAQHKTQV